MSGSMYDDSGRRDHTYGNTGPGVRLVHVSIVGISVGFFLLLNRLYWRWKKATPGVDDILITVAWLSLVLLGIVSYKAVDFGYGRPQATLTRLEASSAERMFYVYQTVYKLSINFSKLSILALYLRVFGTTGWFGNTTKCLVVIVAGYTISAILANIFNCTPISMNWDTSPNATPIARSDGRCINILAFWYTSAIYNISSEVVMLLAVLVRIWTLSSRAVPPVLHFRQKVNLTIVLGLGVFTAATAILRMTTLSRTAVASDKTGGTLVSTVWSSIEASLGVTLANLPMLRQLLRWKGWYGARWFGSTARSRGSQRRSLSMQQIPHGEVSSQPLSAIHLHRRFQRTIVDSDTDTSSLDIEARSDASLARDSAVQNDIKSLSELRDSIASDVAPTAPYSMLQNISPKAQNDQPDVIQAILPVHLLQDKYGACSTIHTEEQR